ncbi:hypothetical protein [Ruegeria lacuscaerulensis]|uniref:hypothetical protein n=1 Tax=Ruegeria lacuscaerulensis TaxID=55218 RepID=UPI00147D72B9|nr:hypothetical protein [Ruegeria lacuscaerulensis]
MKSAFKLERDMASLPKTVEIECPNCQKPAKFVPAELEVRPNQSNAAEVRRDTVVMKFEHPRRNYANWHREHELIYIGLGGTSIHSPDGLYPVGMHRHQLSSLWGTSICGNCHVPKKTKINWPQDAFFQLSFSGRLLWFYNRANVIAMLELLSGADAVGHPWGYWFDRKLPTVFKTVRAHRQLPAKLKRMLRA